MRIELWITPRLFSTTEHCVVLSTNISGPHTSRGGGPDGCTRKLLRAYRGSPSRCYLAISTRRHVVFPTASYRTKYTPTAALPPFHTVRWLPAGCTPSTSVATVRPCRSRILSRTFDSRATV